MNTKSKFNSPKVTAPMVLKRCVLGLGNFGFLLLGLGAFAQDEPAMPSYDFLVWQSSASVGPAEELVTTFEGLEPLPLAQYYLFISDAVGHEIGSVNIEPPALPQDGTAEDRTKWFGDKKGFGFIQAEQSQDVSGSLYINGELVGTVAPDPYTRRIAYGVQLRLLIPPSGEEEEAGINPQTGAPIWIPAKHVVKFRVSKTYVDKVTGGTRAISEGGEHTVDFLPKIKVELVVPDTGG